MGNRSSTFSVASCGDPSSGAGHYGRKVRKTLTGRALGGPGVGGGRALGAGERWGWSGVGAGWALVPVVHPPPSAAGPKRSRKQLRARVERRARSPIRGGNALISYGLRQGTASQSGYGRAARGLERAGIDGIASAVVKTAPGFLSLPHHSRASCPIDRSRRLSLRPRRRISPAMQTRIPFLLCLALVLAVPAAAQTKKPEPAHPAAAASNAPKEIAAFEDWTAATHQEGGQTVCYALTRAQNSTPKPARTGRGRADRHRAPGRARYRGDRGRLRLCQGCRRDRAGRSDRAGFLHPGA